LPQPHIALVARYYSPQTCGGVRRPYFLARGLREIGAQVTIIAPDEDPEFESIVVPHPHRDPDQSHNDTASRSWRSHPAINTLREWRYMPDPDSTWVSNVVRKLASIPEFSPDVIWTTSPPESAHRAGVTVARASRSSWIADMRDPWFVRPQRVVRTHVLRRTLETRLARRWLANASGITAVNEDILQEGLRLSGLPESRGLLLPHFLPSHPEPIDLGPGTNLVHTGQIQASDPRSKIDPLLRAFEAAATVDGSLKLHLVGRLTEVEHAKVKASKAYDKIVLRGSVSLKDSLGIQSAADALILVGAADAPAPPSKYFEYLGAKKPIIAVGSGPWREAIDVPKMSADKAMLQIEALRTPSQSVPIATQVAESLIEFIERIR